MKIQDLLLISDLDGTLIGENYQIPERNLKAIRRFQEKGGQFAIATGRSGDSGAQYYHQSQPNGLSVLLNGAVIYDFETDRVVKSVSMPPQASEYARILAEHFPEVGYEVFTERDLFVLRCNRYIQAHLEHEGLSCVETKAEDIPGSWCKVLFASEPEIKQKMHDFTDTFSHPGVRFVQTSSHFLEMLPDEVNKGTGLDEILNQTGISRSQVVAIGDYYNDVELLKAAGFAAVPSNAPQDIQDMADLVVGHCYEGAVADLIEYLEQTHQE
ncbi:Cof-type HAD-IIB family hydrolase [Clostridium minihomine]|uniref:Cof-type HAD-IIB family hydrolase n=1 Tax=Clostridium minihomine TaxID=2045012 RepID=UPI000C77C7E5|nr:Cof-type HAD-IIB family hydrolase [Clostridium minihomine]